MVRYHWEAGRPDFSHRNGSRTGEFQKPHLNFKTWILFWLPRPHHLCDVLPASQKKWKHDPCPFLQIPRGYSMIPNRPARKHDVLCGLTWQKYQAANRTDDHRVDHDVPQRRTSARWVLARWGNCWCGNGGLKATLLALKPVKREYKDLPESIQFMELS